MKKLKYTLNSGYTDWQAMLTADYKYSFELVELLDNCIWDPSVWKHQDTIPFKLIGDRTVDPSSEEVEEMGNDGFAKKYPHGKPLHQPGDKGQEFRDILEWGSIFMTEHKVTDNPCNGGGNTYRIISPKLKQVLEQFNLPPHRFYPVEVTHEITGEKQSYYLFHLTHELGDHLDTAFWPMMETTVIKRGQFNPETNSRTNDEIVGKFGLGSITDVQDYFHKTHIFTRDHAGIAIEGKIDFSSPEGQEAKKKLRFYSTKESHYVYEKPYDLLGLETTIVISEDLKKALEENFPGKDLYFESKNMVDVVTGYQPGEELPF